LGAQRYGDWAIKRKNGAKCANKYPNIFKKIKKFWEQSWPPVALLSLQDDDFATHEHTRDG